MFKVLFLNTKYPYTAGVIGVIWIFTAILAWLEPGFPILKAFVFDMFACLIIAYVGFKPERV